MSEVKFRLEEGKKYVDRRGRVFGPMIESRSGGVFGETVGDNGWMGSGLRLGPNDPRESDLIAEYVEPVKDSEEWVELCDPEHVLRSGVDEYFDDGKHLNKWMPILASASKKIKDCPNLKKFRCRLEDLPQLTSCVLSTVKTEESPKPPKIEWYQHRRNESVVIQVHDRSTVFYIENGIYSPTFGYEDMKVNFGYQLTEEEALKLIQENTPKPAPVVESPDDWVIQDRVPSRRFTDEFQWVVPGGALSTWSPCEYGGGMHGERDKAGVLEIRCRRKDLPSLPPTAPPADIPPTTIPVRLWTSHRVLFEGGDWPVRCGEQIPTGIGHHVEIKIGPNGFYIEKE